MVEASPEINGVAFQELFFEVGGLRLFGKRYGTQGGKPVIALHGWMDNCASFDFLAPQLQGCDVLCIDCAGHGKSDHRPHLGAYNIWQDIAELFCIADHLGWNTFTLIGHSRGGICSFLAAGTLPHRITHLVLLEGVYPPLGSPQDAPKTLAESIEALLASQDRPKRFYDTFNQAVSARVNGLVPVTLEDATTLGAHGVVQSDQGFAWRYDYKLSIGSEVRFSLEQIQAFQTRIAIKTLVILAEDGMYSHHKEFSNAISTFSQAQILTLPGDHHFHMHGQNQLVAEKILEYLFESSSLNSN